MTYAQRVAARSGPQRPYVTGGRRSWPSVRAVHGPAGIGRVAPGAGLRRTSMKTNLLTRTRAIAGTVEPRVVRPVAPRAGLPRAVWQRDPLTGKPLLCWSLAPLGAAAADAPARAARGAPVRGRQRADPPAEAVRTAGASRPGRSRSSDPGSGPSRSVPAARSRSPWASAGRSPDARRTRWCHRLARRASARGSCR